MQIVGFPMRQPILYGITCVKIVFLSMCFRVAIVASQVLGEAVMPPRSPIFLPHIVKIPRITYESSRLVHLLAEIMDFMTKRLILWFSDQV